MKPGDVIETAIWLTGEETGEDRKRYARDACDAIAALACEHGVVTGPVRWVEKRPGDERVPEVPDHIHGIDVRLLVAEADVLCHAPNIIIPGSFVSDLDPKDLARLRDLTRKAHRKVNPGAKPLTDAECDTVIEELGPEVALKQVREAVDYGLLN